jgi:hypothetical protein
MISKGGCLLSSLLLAVGLTGCDSGASRTDEPEVFDAAGIGFSTARLVQYALPKALTEVSGLDLSRSGHLLAHGDEQARVFEIGYVDGTVTAAFQLGDPPVRGDFEGIASADGSIFLVTSAGTIYEVAPGDGKVRGYTRHDAELPCEIEGLAPWGPRDLVAVCKHIYDGDDVLRGYRWSLAERRYDPAPLFSVGKREFDKLVADLKKLRPSGITPTPDGGLLVVGRHGKDPMLLTLGPDFHPVSLVELPRSSRHTQPEGIGLTAAGVLLVADEAGSGGVSNGRGRLSVYRP